MGNRELWGRNLPTFWGGDFFREMDRALEDMGRWPTNGLASADMLKFRNPNCEVGETPMAYTVKMDVPGLNKDQIKIELHNNRLTVSGERREEKKEDDKDKKTHFSEMRYGSFMRSFDFPTSVNSERVEAKYDNGVLHLSIPKETPSAARQITIK